MRRAEGCTVSVTADGIDSAVSMTVPMEQADLAAQRAGNRSDIWHSRDGIHWEEQPAPLLFLPRHASSVCVHAGALLVMAGNAVAADGSWTVSDVWSLHPHDEGRKLSSLQQPKL